MRVLGAGDVSGAAQLGARVAVAGFGDRWPLRSLVPVWEAGAVRPVNAMNAAPLGKRSGLPIWAAMSGPPTSAMPRTVQVNWSGSTAR